MKTVLFVALLVVAASAVQVQRQQNVGTGGGGGQLQQCSCDDQYKGFREWKNLATQCFDQCRINRHTELQKMLDTPVKIYPCLDQKVDMIHRMFDCVNGKLIQSDSCTAESGTTGTTGTTGGNTESTTGGNRQGMLNYQDFRQLFLRNIEPYVNEIHTILQQIDQNNQHQFGNILMDIADCSRTCLFDKIRQSQYWDQLNCVPMVNENSIQTHIQSCFHDMHLKDTFYKICRCTVGVGVTNLQPFCQQLRTVRFPQWAERGPIEFLNRIGMLDEEGQQGQMSQFGQLGQHPRAQKMIVKLAIEQEQPDMMGQQQGMFGQGGIGSQQQGYTGGQQGGIGGSMGGGGIGGSQGTTGYKQNRYQSQIGTGTSGTAGDNLSFL